MAEQTMKVERRELFGKNNAGRLRRGGKVPGILYGDGKEPVALTIDPEAVDEILASTKGENTIFDLELAGTGQKRPAMIHDYQRHPVRQAIIHVDFVRVNMERKISVRVPVVLEGLPEGVKNSGGILEFLHRDIHLECLPGNIPPNIKIDVTPLGIGQSVRVGDLKLDPALFRVLDDADTAVAVVALPAAEKEVAPVGDEPVATEPEVVKKGKEKAEEAGDKKPAADAKPAGGKPEAKKPEAKKPEAKKPEKK